MSRNLHLEPPAESANDTVVLQRAVGRVPAQGGAAPNADAPPVALSAEPERTKPAAIGRYLVLSLVGKGAMGEVYAAYDPELDRKVAIKLLRGKPGDGAEASEGRARMMREAQAIAKLSHPNVVVVYDVGAFEDQVFVAMEFMDGHTLWYWMHAQPRGWMDVLKIFAEAGRGLAAAHEKNLIHRDFKPENVMICADGQVRVMDFGLARTVGGAGDAPGARAGTAAQNPRREPERAPAHVAIGADADPEDLLSTRDIARGQPIPSHATAGSQPSTISLTQAGAVVGTPAYMSPEQFRGSEIDPRTDQFSFCVALYEALYGERPFRGNTPQALQDSVMSGAVREPPAHSDVPRWVRTLLLRGLSAEADDRWPCMKALLKELEKNRSFARRRRFTDGAAAKLSDIWQAPGRGRAPETTAKREMREAFLATGKRYAAATFENVSHILDRYAKSWSDMYVDICQATHVRGEQSTEVLDLRMACLMDLRERLRALCHIFRQANAEVVENAVRAATSLGNVARCADLEFLRSAVKPPEDPATRLLVDRLRSGLADARVLCQVGRLNDGLKAIAAIEPEVRAANYVPLLAELLLESGKLYTERREGESAARALEDAVWAAELCRHEEVAAESATLLVFVTGETQRFDLAEIWSRHAETILHRMGGSDTIWGWLFNNRGVVRRRQGRIEDAIADTRLALAAKEKASGADSPDVAQSLGNMALCLTEADQPEQALPFIERCIHILDATLGPDHPRGAFMQSNYAEVLNRLGRFREAREVALRTLAIFEREISADDVTISYPLAALGVAYLGEGRAEEALAVLERASALCSGKSAGDPAHAGGVDFALARALFAAGRDLPRARVLAVRAQDEFAQVSGIAMVARELEKVRQLVAATSVPAA